MLILWAVGFHETNADGDWEADGVLTRAGKLQFVSSPSSILMLMYLLYGRSTTAKSKVTNPPAS